MSERDKRLALLVIAHLDDDGYLTAPVEELHEIGVAEIPDLEIEEISIALHQVQNLEPAGVGARDLSECLALQLKALDPATPHRDCAIELVSRHLDVLAARDFNKLRRLLGVTEDELREVRALILTLDPKPGRAWGEGDVRYVVPDVTVRKAGTRWVAAAQPRRDAAPAHQQDVRRPPAVLARQRRPATSPGSCRRRAGSSRTCSSASTPSCA